MKKSLTKRERLKKTLEIRSVFKQGRRVSCPGAKGFFLENGLTWNRIAVTLSKKYGISVERNRTKRLFRELYRTSKELLKTGYDIVLLAYPGEYGYEDRKKQVDILFRKAGLYRK